MAAESISINQGETLHRRLTGLTAGGSLVGDSPALTAIFVIAKENDIEIDSAPVIDLSAYTTAAGVSFQMLGAARSQALPTGVYQYALRIFLAGQYVADLRTGPITIDRGPTNAISPS